MVVWGLCACDSTSPAPCVYEDRDACWQYLGLRSKSVLSLLETPSGLFAGTLGNGVWLLSPASVGFLGTANGWQPRGLEGVNVNALLSVKADTRTPIFAAVSPGSPSAPPVAAVVFVSYDNGATWMARDDSIASRAGGGVAFALAADTGRPRHVYAGLGNALIRTENLGQTWSTLLGNPSEGSAAILAIALARKPGLQRTWAGGSFLTGPFLRYSDDDGTTWRTPTRTGYVGDWVDALLPGDANVDELFVGMIGTVRHTLDAGATWQVALQLRYVGFIAALLRVPGRILAVTLEIPNYPLDTITKLGVYTSTNTGMEWKALSTPASATGAWSAIAGAHGTLVIGTTTGVWRVHLR